MRKIRIAQIGVNRHSHSAEIFNTIKSLPDIFEMVGYVLVEDERETCKGKINKFFAKFPELSLDNVLNDPTIEAVAVETDEIHITKYATMAIEHGKHVHMEKPGSQSLSDFENLINTARKSDKVFHIGYMYRYNPYIADVIKRAQAGELGKIYSVEAHMSRAVSKALRDWLSTFKGGMMFFLGCHLIDIVMQIQGVPTEVVPLNTVTGLDSVSSEDLGFAVLKYPDAVSVVRTGGSEIGGFDRRQLVVCGSKATVEIRPLEVLVSDENRRYMVYTEKSESFLNELGKTNKIHDRTPSFQRYEAMLTAFAEMVRGEKENPYALDYELELFKTILKCCGT